jgi:uncharacterized protein DUF4255
MPIQAVTLAIRDLLLQALHAVRGIPANSFSVYVGPPDAGRMDDELILFLLRINPNADLRNADLARSGTAGPDAALPLDLHYLVTAGSPANITSTEGLTRLGHAIRAIESASPLSVPSHGQDAVWLSLEPMSTEELSRIWGLFPNYNCRTSFVFRAGPVWIESGRAAAPAPQVRTQGAAAEAA